MNETILFCISGAIASAWLPNNFLRHAAGGGLVVVALVLALHEGAVSAPAIPWIVALFGSAWWVKSAAKYRWLSWTVFMAVALALGFGIAPGFSSIPLTEAAPLKEASASFGLRLRIEKPLVGFALVMWIVPLSRTVDDWRSVARTAAPVAAITMLIVFPMGLALGYVAPAIGFPAAGTALLWMIMNLLLVCPAEEGFFRGLLQRELARRVPGAVSIAVAAALFGLAHFAGGPVYVLLASVAGAGYGLAYHLAGQRIEAAIGTHFLLNLAHFGLFTYPYAVVR